MLAIVMSCCMYLNSFYYVNLLSLKAHLRLLMTECRFDDEEIANIVLQLLEEVEGNGNADVEYPLQYYVDAAKDHKELDKARNFLIKECNICLVEQTIHEVGDVYCQN